MTATRQPELQLTRGSRTLVATSSRFRVPELAAAVRASCPGANLEVLLFESLSRPDDFLRVASHVTELVSDGYTDRSLEAVHSAVQRAFTRVDGSDVVLLVDSLTRLARFYNHFISPTESHRHLSAGIIPERLEPLKRLFQASPQRGSGSLTVLAIVHVETGSRMDHVVHEEFKKVADAEIVWPGRTA